MVTLKCSRMSGVTSKPNSQVNEPDVAAVTLRSAIVADGEPSVTLTTSLYGAKCGGSGEAPSSETSMFTVAEAVLIPSTASTCSVYDRRFS